MGSPPQGYIANSLSAGTTTAISLRTDSSGRLGYFLGATEVFYLDTIAAPNFRMGNPQSNATNFFETGPLGAFTLSTNNVDQVGKSNAGDLEFFANIFNTISKFRNITTGSGGNGIAPLMGVDNRSGLVAADGAPITLFTVPATTLQLHRITADIYATVVTAGTANYTITWTENALSKTMVVSASVVNTLATATDLINPDPGTAITAQLTFAAFTGTVKVASVVEWIAGN